MSYFAICTFDLVNCGYEDYQKAYDDLVKIGFKRDITANDGSIVRLPTTTTAGEFNGESVEQIRNNLSDKVENAFSARGFKSEIFISVSGNWAWSRRITK
ncbi:MAG: hypothetical protein CVU71_00970 [Deltaproteobacteria bacterium HGW-Deltaproteobacteria-6]|jgi:CRISPR/Cas system Type II protein with McrA/HNH and RuvC-like nuclease domain|nr:MAG: hypothetical protein CVU71_00970 [Deltaproteobacteria bacterium HGW-Deltaproteobacteria-6]